MNYRAIGYKYDSINYNLELRNIKDYQNDLSTCSSFPKVVKDNLKTT